MSPIRLVPALLLGLLLLAGVAGARASGPRMRALASLAAVGGLVVTLLVVSAPVQTRLSPRAPLLAGRLAPLGEAVRAAARAAGDGGWVSLDAPEIHEAVALRLKDFAPGRGFVIPDVGSSSLPLPDVVLQSNRPVVVVSRRENWAQVTTLEGQGIFQARILGRHGPWVVVRVERT